MQSPQTANAAVEGIGICALRNFEMNTKMAAPSGAAGDRHANHGREPAAWPLLHAMPLPYRPPLFQHLKPRWIHR